MGAFESKQSSNPVLARIEHEAVRAAVPKGLKDERSRQLEYDLNWCYNRNNWYFTAGGLLTGMALGYSLRSVQPIAWAAILSPAADWLYEQHACRDLQTAFAEHQKALREQARDSAERARADVREQYSVLVGGGDGGDAAVAAAAGSAGGGGGGAVSEVGTGLDKAAGAVPAAAEAISLKRSDIVTERRDNSAAWEPRPRGTDDDIFVPQSCMAPEEADQAVQRFSRLLQFRTVSNPGADHHVEEPEQFRRLHEWMAGAFPEAWETLEVEQVGSAGLSLLIRWPGTSDNGTSPAGGPPPPRPALFVSHLDVVPVLPETLDQWTYPPFSGAVQEGYIGVSGLLEAATLLIRSGWRPRRTLYFAFGQDEEVGGDMGAALTADLLEQRGVQFDAVYDEGGSIGSDGFQPYTSRPVALVGTAEKGYATVMAHVTTVGGHSSRPPLDGSAAASIAARLIASIDARPPPAALVGPVTSFLSALAPLTPGLRGVLFWLAGSGLGGPELGKLVAEGILARDAPETAALVRNTAAVTGLSSGIAENVLPPAAAVRVNFRLLPGSNTSDILAYLERAAGRDLPHFKFELAGGQEPSLATPVTPTSSHFFGVLATAIQEVYKLADGSGSPAVAPTLMLGGTDSKHYLRLSGGQALRHVPVSGSRAAGDSARVHGLNERLSVGDHGRAVCVYRRLLQLVGDAEVAAASPAGAGQ
ncbi:hypothetical protein GPECTOR_10g1068 [Gonium pectorale]|uniref:Peptidase M20 dimerisation domain-containing protein n=1 Tax=Gonium pectorale TaxID=33097 RepID=A0A150GQF1_GONPE|nr:hypothetical protein GPECTOR_10g1068 [Gonium pectorale]|eukprot:KXZ52045.1 hypothetical protein GPECTOR_10g1068 [Gonium pectorale]